MAYAERNLAPGETIVYRARYHWVIYRTGLVLLLLALLLGASSLYAAHVSPGAGVAVPVAWLALAFGALALLAILTRRIRASMDEFVVTSRRVIHKVGFFSREIEQAPLEKIQDITIDQGVLGRLWNFGTVTLETASERGTLVFPGIARPESFRNALWGQAPAAPAAGVTPPVVTAPPVAPAPPAAASLPTGDRLAELERLRQQGFVSDEEYAAKRREILSGL